MSPPFQSFSMPSSVSGSTDGQLLLGLCKLDLLVSDKNIFANFLFVLRGVVNFENILGIQFQQINSPNLLAVH